MTFFWRGNAENFWSGLSGLARFRAESAGGRSRVRGRGEWLRGVRLGGLLGVEGRVKVRFLCVCR